MNFAVCNIQQIAQVDVTDDKKIADAITQKGDGTIQKLANFLWLFNVDEPGRDFSDYKDITLKLVTKIFALRNLFAHPQGRDITPLLSDREFYIILEGINRFDRKYQAAKREFFARYPDGESYFDLAARVFPLIKELDGANALLVTHGGICRMIRSYFEDMGNEEFVQFSQGNCEVRIYP